MHTINVYQQLFTHSFMKKISFLLLFCICAVFVSAQLSITGNHLLIGKKIGNDSVTVILFDSISSSTTISYAGTNVRFYKYTDANSNTNPIYPSLSPDDATGYIIKVDDIPTDTIWVIDYKLYKPFSIEPEFNPTAQCQNVLLNLSVPEISYQTIDKKKYVLPRDFNIKYQTLKWEGTDWGKTDTIVTLTLPKSQESVPAPYCNTIFTLYGDQYAADLGIDTVSVSSKDYITNAVICNLTTVVSDRTHEKNNEANAPDNTAADLSFSAPIDIQFLSNPSDAVSFFNWNIYKDGQLIINRNDRDHRYTFSDQGDYVVKVNVSNSTCSYSDSIKITAYEAAIQVPKVFTPNGDNLNDEFRVAYKSLLSFECWVSNRWGRKVFYWNDPQKGWNGKIGRADAAEGPYFYIIKATGYGLKPDPKNPGAKVKSTIILKGDITLLRGLKK